MSKFEQLRNRLSHAVASLDEREKTAVLEEVKTPAFFDGLTELEATKLRALIGDIWSTRLEDSFALQPA